MKLEINHKIFIYRINKKYAMMTNGEARMDGGSVRTKNVLILPGCATTKLIATTKVMRKTVVSRNMFKLILIL